MGVPVNTDLSIAFWVPVVAIKLELGGNGANLTNFFKRLLLIGHMRSGTGKLLRPTLLIDQGSVNLLYGASSDLACQFAHAASQNAAAGGGGIEIWGVAIAEPAGTPATKLIKVVAQPNDDGTPGSNTSAQAAGYLDVYVAGWKHAVPVSSGDTFAVIAASIASVITAALQAPQNPYNTPIASASAGGTATVTLTTHKGVSGNDLPLRVDVSNPAMKIRCSPGTLSFTNAVNPDGVVQLTAGTLTAPAAVTNGFTISQSAAAIAAVVRAGDYNLTCYDNSVAVAGQVVLLFADGCDLLAMSCTITGTAQAQTATLAVGTAGTGAPDVAAALTALRTATAWRLWTCPFSDATSCASIYNHVEEMAGGLYMKGQVVFFGSNADLVTAGAIPTASTPKLTTSPRYAVNWAGDSGVRSVDLAARSAAAALGDDYVAANFDGLALRTSGVVPLGVPRATVRPDRTTVCNTAIVTYHLTPLVADDDGVFQIMRGTTTVQAATDDLTNWGVIFGLDYARAFAVQKLRKRFKRRNLKKQGEPQSDRTVNPESVADCVKEILDDLEQGANGAQADIVDGADELKKLVRFAGNPSVSGRVDCTFPIRIPPPLHQIGVVEQFLPS